MNTVCSAWLAKQNGSYHFQMSRYWWNESSGHCKKLYKTLQRISLQSRIAVLQKEKHQRNLRYILLLVEDAKLTCQQKTASLGKVLCSDHRFSSCAQGERVSSLLPIACPYPTAMYLSSLPFFPAVFLLSGQSQSLLAKLFICEKKSSLSRC